MIKKKMSELMQATGDEERADRFPRVLIINDSAFGAHTATAITLTNLFRAWPKDRLAIVHTEKDIPDNPVSGRVWALSTNDIPVEKVVRRVLGRMKRAIVGEAASGLPGGLGVSGAQESQPMRVKFHGIVSAWAAMLPYCPPPAFRDWIDDFRPEVIYSMVSSMRIMRVALETARRKDVPIVPHFMDDWPSTYYKGILKAVPRAAMTARLRAVLRRSSVAMTIGSSMAAEFTQRYKMPFEAFMNCVDVPSQPPPKVSANSQRLRFVFSGGLHLNRWVALAELGAALSEARKEGVDAELLVYTSTAEILIYGKALEDVATITLRESLPTEKLIAELRAADVLVHVDSFEHATMEYLRYSMSTKLPLYMATGRPILVYGPAHLSSTRYIRECMCGVAVTEQNPKALLDQVMVLAASRSRREAMGLLGWQAAKANHDGDVVRERFRLAFLRAAKRAGKK